MCSTATTFDVYSHGYRMHMNQPIRCRRTGYSRKWPMFGSNWPMYIICIGTIYDSRVKVESGRCLNHDVGGWVEIGRCWNLILRGLWVISYDSCGRVENGRCWNLILRRLRLISYDSCGWVENGRCWNLILRRLWVISYDSREMVENGRC